MKIVSVKEASHASSELKKELEFSKMHSDALFLKGLKSGSATLSVRIMEPGLEDIESAAVSITVTEPFVVIPSNTVYMLPTSKFHFDLAKVSLRDSEMHFAKISLPSKQYSWSTLDSDKGDIGEDGVFISKDREGFVNILVTDQFIANNSAESSVKVVFPQLLDLEIADVTE